MKFSELIDQATGLLQRKGRLRYRSLQREFELDDETLEDLRDELIEGQAVAVDEGAKILVWAGDGGTLPSPRSPTPLHLHAPTPGRAYPSRTANHGVPWQC